MGEKKDVHRGLLGKPEGKRTLESLGRRWEDNTKWIFLNWDGSWTGLISFRIGAVAGCFECGSEVLDSIKCRVLFENLLASQEGLCSIGLVS